MLDSWYCKITMFQTPTNTKALVKWLMVIGGHVCISFLFYPKSQGKNAKYKLERNWQLLAQTIPISHHIFSPTIGLAMLFHLAEVLCPIQSISRPLKKNLHYLPTLSRQDITSFLAWSFYFEPNGRVCSVYDPLSVWAWTIYVTHWATDEESHV